MCSKILNADEPVSKYINISQCKAILTDRKVTYLFNITLFLHVLVIFSVLSIAILQSFVIMADLFSGFGLTTATIIGGLSATRASRS